LASMVPDNLMHPRHAIRPIPDTRIRHDSSSGSAESAFHRILHPGASVRNPTTPRKPMISSLAVSDAPLQRLLYGASVKVEELCTRSWF
jgi:hypothetical protein